MLQHSGNGFGQLPGFILNYSLPGGEQGVVTNGDCQLGLIQLGAEQIGQTVVLDVLVKLFLQLLKLLLFLLTKLGDICGARIRSNDIVHFIGFTLIELSTCRSIRPVFHHSRPAIQCRTEGLCHFFKFFGIRCTHSIHNEEQSDQQRH
ncbi:hypothetical protein D3C74_394010 [compost metagenome]